MTVVTRFAPSPTGELHIGGARTALFNWLFARGRGGQFLLRIEDTDRARSTPEAVDAILEGLGWLGLTPDGPPVFQFARAGRHAEIAHALVDQGKAFRCYVTAAELDDLRAQLEAARHALHEAQKHKASSAEIDALSAAIAVAAAKTSRSPYRDGTLRAPSPDAPYVIRLRAPDSGVIRNPDLVQGVVSVPAGDIDDLVLLRADGTPTYMLAVVVDDHDMGVTHVIRGDDHLTNAARQIPIFEAMGWPVPLYAHIPLIHGPDGKKLSKRHGALGAHAYRDLGYLPEAVLNYLARLGWSHGDTELFSLSEAAAWFDLGAVSKGPARLDFAKLNHVNAHYLRAADPGRLAPLVGPVLRDLPGVDGEKVTDAALIPAIPALVSRAHTVLELADALRFLVLARPLQADHATTKHLTADTQNRVVRLAAALTSVTEWRADTLAEAVKAFAAAEGLGMGQIGPAARAALTGGAPAPDLGLSMALLGRQETLARLTEFPLMAQASA
jgi:glutamyl-tRNA synthetase